MTQVMSLYGCLMDHLIRFWVKYLSKGETCCVYDDQDVVSEKEQGGRCNGLLRKNQSSMLHVPGTKEFGLNLCHETRG